MQNSQALISVIIPVYNSERYLGEAIASILAQSLPPAEIIIVDDGSTDSSVAVARSFGRQVRSYVQPNGGPGAARNLGVHHAHGALLAFLDADDLWMPDKLAHQFTYLKANPLQDMVFGQVEQFISPELSTAQCLRLPEQRVMSGLHAGAMLIWRQRFAAVGPFATNWTIGEFIDWYGRAQAAGLRSAHLPEIVMRRRLHETNLTRRTNGQRRDYLKILKTQLDAKRTQASPETFPA